MLGPHITEGQNVREDRAARHPSHKVHNSAAAALQLEQVQRDLGAAVEVRASLPHKGGPQVQPDREPPEGYRGPTRLLREQTAVLPERQLVQHRTEYQKHDAKLVEF